MTKIFHLFFMSKMDPMSGVHIRLVFTLPPRGGSTKDAYNSEITFLFIQSLSFWPTDFWFGDETGFLLDIQNSKEQKLNGKKNNIQTNNKLSLNIFMIFKIQFLQNHIKELSLCNKIKYLNPNIFRTQCCKTLIF